MTKTKWWSLNKIFFVGPTNFGWWVMSFGSYHSKHPSSKQHLRLAAWLSCEFQPRGNWIVSLYFLSCSAPAGMTLQLLTCLARVQLLATCKPRATCEIQLRVPVSLHNLEHFFTLCHILPLHDFHQNTRLLIAKIQANLARNKANKMVDKIQPYTN